MRDLLVAELRSLDAFRDEDFAGVEHEHELETEWADRYQRGLDRAQHIFESLDRDAQRELAPDLLDLIDWFRSYLEHERPDDPPRRPHLAVRVSEPNCDTEPARCRPLSSLSTSKRQFVNVCWLIKRRRRPATPLARVATP